MKHSHIVLLAFLATLFGVAQSHAKDTRLMTDAEYKSFLGEVDSSLPVWEAALKKVDPAKTDASYAVGEQIIRFRDLALTEIAYVRQSAAKQHVKRTVSGELSLSSFLRGVFDAMGSVVEIEVASGLTLSTLESFASQTSKLVGSISNDVIARVELLEKGTCP